jgi:hypothetical protein
MSIFPVLPLTSALSKYAEIHQAAAYAFGLGIGAFSIFMIVLWSVNYSGTDKERSSIRTGVAGLGLAVICLLFGLYAAFPLVLGLVIFILYNLAKGIVIAFKRK